MMQGIYDIKMVNAQFANIMSVKIHLHKVWKDENLWQCIISLLVSSVWNTSEHLIMLTSPSPHMLQHVCKREGINFSKFFSLILCIIVL